MKLNVRLFATLKELTGASLVTLEIQEPASVTDLLACKNHCLRQWVPGKGYTVKGN
jgi:molybdopterin converting factor small subunit